MSEPPAVSSLELRPTGPEDRGFLYRLYASTREEELATVDWAEGQKEAFLTQQFSAQDHHYHTYYPGARFDLVVVAGEPVGRLYVARWTREIRLIDIALLPASRGAGIGTRLISELQAEAAAAGKTLTIHVEMYNPALALYQRLGFRPIDTVGVYYLMEWRAESVAEAPAPT
ncbi:MAG TPA: GNAT family N-acetyltransferase [Thermoanaerobaculia bacterium]|nr:GNAT family N-acetyltransferase [Thermoanaerobaculia bacterium]